MSIVDVFDFKNVCRTCLSFGSLESLYDETSTEETLANMLMVCTSVKYLANDDLPMHMCTDCISELNQSYKFALKCQEIDEELRIYKQKLLSVENAKRQSVIITTLKMQNNSKPDAVKNETNLDQKSHHNLQKLDLQSSNRNSDTLKTDMYQITNNFMEVTPIIFDSLDPKMPKTDNVALERHKLDTHLLDQSITQINLDQALTKRPNLDQVETNNNIAQTHLDHEISHNLDLALSHLNKALPQSLNIGEENERNDIFRAITPVIEQFTMNIKLENISDCETEILDTENADGHISDCDTVILEAETQDANISDCDTDILDVEKPEKDVSDCETDILEVDKTNKNIEACKTDIFERKPSNINDKLTIAKSNQKDEAPFMCTIYENTFDKQLSLVSHMQTDNELKTQEIHSCRYCFRTFHDVNKFREHIPVHNGEKPYSCRECNYKVKGIKKFQEHKRFHHEERRYQRALYNKNKDLASAPYLCGDFSPAFKTTRPQFAYHMRTHQTERYSHNNAYTRHKVLNAREFRGFRCRYCDHSFLRRHDLITHSYQMHPRPKRYTASVYDPTFVRDEEMPSSYI